LSGGKAGQFKDKTGQEGMIMAEIPKTCKAAVLEEYNKPLQIREVPVPEVEPRGILVKVEMAGICGTDVHQSHGTLTIKPPLPNLQGHETIGRIVKLGEGRTIDVAGEPIKVGDRIMWAHADCGECYWCEIARDTVLCAARQGYGFANPSFLRGGFAEYEYITPITKVVRIPDQLTEEEAIGVGCAFRTVVGGFERLGGVRLQEDVVIQGSGPVGLYSLITAVETGARKVIVVGAPATRLELAKKWGASHVINIDDVKDPAVRKEQILALTSGRGPQLVVECSGVPAAFNEGLDMIQKGGRYLVLGQTSHATIPMAPGIITGKALTVVGSASAAIPHFYKALQFIAARRTKYPFAEIVTTKYRLEQINEALANMATGKEIKPVIDNRGR
jgi:L-iditol 2-dehydrogenase